MQTWHWWQETSVHPLEWPQPRITASPGSHVCSVTQVSVRPSASRAGGFVLPGGWIIFIWEFCVGFKSKHFTWKKKLKELRRMVLPRKSGMTVKNWSSFFLKGVPNSWTWLSWKQFHMWAVRVWWPQTVFCWLLALIFHPILILLPVIIPPLDSEEGAKLPLAELCVEFQICDGGEIRKEKMCGRREKQHPFSVSHFQASHSFIN